MNDENSTNQTTNNSSGIFGTPMNIVTDTSSDINNTNPQNTSNQNLEVDSGKTEDTDLNSVGVTFVYDEDQTKSEPNIFSTDSAFKNKENEALSTLVPSVFDEKQKPINNPESLKENNQIAESTPLIQQNVQDVPTEELEQDFSSTFNSVISPDLTSKDSQDHLKIEEEKLKKLHKELKGKANTKKMVVKERLEKLKAEKESLGKELEEIKEIEGIALKIEEKLKALMSIDTEIDTLEVKAQEELK